MKLVRKAVVTWTAVTLAATLWSLLYFDREPLDFSKYRESQAALMRFTWIGTSFELSDLARIKPESAELHLRSIGPRMRILINSPAPERECLTITNVPARHLSVSGGTVRILSETSLVVELRLKKGRNPVSLAWREDYLKRKTFFICGDPQVEAGKDPAVLRRIFDEAKTKKPLFIAIIGDIVENGRKSNYEAAESILAQSPVPVLLCPGNHDIWLGGRRSFERFFGPFFYSTDVGPAHLVLLDTAPGRIYEDEMEWLKKDLAAARRERLLIFSHMPTVDPRPGGHHALLSRDEALAFLSFLAPFRPDAIFSGHVHGLYDFTDGGIPCWITAAAGCTVVGGPDHGFSHFLEVTADRGSFIVKTHPVDGPQGNTIITAINRFVEPLIFWCFNHFTLSLALSAAPLAVHLILSGNRRGGIGRP
jgi:hypothetical protein